MRSEAETLLLDAMIYHRCIIQIVRHVRVSGNPRFDNASIGIHGGAVATAMTELSLSEQAYGQLRRMIVRLDFAPVHESSTELLVEFDGSRSRDALLLNAADSTLVALRHAPGGGVRDGGGLLLVSSCFRARGRDPIQEPTTSIYANKSIRVQLA